MSTYIQQQSESTFIVTFNGTENIHTTLTASGDEVHSWLSQTICLPGYLIGMDLEWRPSFSQVQNPVALLQLCCGNRCLIFQLLFADYIPYSLQQFLSNPRFIFVGVGIRGDVRRLTEDTQLSVLNIVDLRELAAQRMGRLEMRSMGLKALALQIMGVDVNKPRNVTMSRWDRWILTLDQIMYACIDAFVSFEIGRRLYDGGF